MKVVIQRVSESSVMINKKVVGEIGLGFLILLGIEESDTDKDIDWLCHKINGLRVFSDNEGKMNLDIHQVNGEFLVISQFTLHAMTKKGFRPSFIKAAKPETAIPLYEKFKAKLHEISNLKVEAGEFGADMKISLINDGPVTIIIDTKNKE
ncbi:MAG: D-aminoacyl-tRNA deacylase [Brumimicrobium sp.]